MKQILTLMVVGCLAFLAGNTSAVTQNSTVPSSLTPEQKKSAALFKAMRYGIFTTHTYKFTVAPPEKTYKTMEEFTDMFDVWEYARQLESVGVEYVIFTAWHAAMYNLGPNAALEKWLPGHTAKRDLIGELADGLNEKGIKLILYAHPNDGHDLTMNEQVRVGYAKLDKDNPNPIPVFNDFINEVYAEMASRYAAKPNVLGFWWDGWNVEQTVQGKPVYGGHRIDAARLRRTTLAAMPQAIILSQFFDPQIIDFHSGEIYQRRNPQLEIDSFMVRNVHQSIDIGLWWACADMKRRVDYSPETLFRFTVLNACGGGPGGIAWAVSPSADGKTWGMDNLEIFQKIGAYLKPIRESICGVAVSKNWPVQNRKTFSQTSGYGATRSLDGTKDT